MRSSLLPTSLLVPLVALTLNNVASAGPMPEEVIRSFYESYLRTLSNPSGGDRKALGFSEDLRKAIEENRNVCEKYATGVCGFGADGDIYLDSQEYEQGLTLISSGFRIAEEVEGLITVSLNVYPSVSTADHFYEKQVTFKMILEGEGWVVDDILYADHVSSKLRMREENEFYKSNPDPDSPYVKQKRGTDAQ